MRSRSKYGNVKATVGQEVFDSRAEARRWGELLWLQKAGQITDLRRQVPFELVPKQRDPSGRAVRAVVYRADFVYRQGGREVVEDFKGGGIETPAFKIKRKLMLQRHGVWVEVVQ